MNCEFCGAKKAEIQGDKIYSEKVCGHQECQDKFYERYAEEWDAELASLEFEPRPTEPENL